MKETATACFLLTVIIAAGVFVRASATSEPMWLDECHTAWTIDTESPSTVISRAADGNQPPLYFLAVWAVTQLFGVSEFSLRSVSLVASAALMIVASLWAQKLTKHWSAAFLVAGLIAFDGQFIFYATEARSYSLVQLIGLFQATFFWQLLANRFKHEKPKPEAKASEPSAGKPLPFLIAYPAFTLLSIAMLYCHYTSVWLLAAETSVIIALAAIDRKFPTAFFFAGIAIVAAMIPTWWNVAEVFNRRSNWSTVSSTRQLWIDVEPWLVHWIMVPLAITFAAWMIGFMQPKAVNPADQRRERLLWAWIALSPLRR